MKRPLMLAWLRLFSLQGSWSFERLQGLGIAVAIEPLLRGLPGGRGGAAYRRALGRAAGYFNTHPYLAGLAVGAVARAEHDEIGEDDVEHLRTGLKGALGALGDRLVWSGLLPLAVAVGLGTAVLVHPAAGVAAFLVVFNAVHLALRLWCLPVGWKLGTSVVKALRNPLLQRGAGLFRIVGVTALGFAIPVVGQRLLQDFEATGRVGAVIVAAATLVFARWLAPSVGGARLGAVAIIGVLVAGWLWP